jgi:hypothetical protein
MAAKPIARTTLARQAAFALLLTPRRRRQEKRFGIA